MSFRLRRLAFAFLFAAGAACAQSPKAPTADGPQTELSGQVVYQMLLGEIAAQRGQWALAGSAYLDLARTTRDPRIAKRGAELAFHSRQYDIALQIAKLWLSLEPEAIPAKQMYSTLLLASGRIDELTESLGRDLAQEGPRVGEALMRIGGIFSRLADKALVWRIIDRVTQPYLTAPEARLVRAQAVAVRDQAQAMTEIDQAIALKPDWELPALFKASLYPRGEAQLGYLKTYLATHPEAREVRLAYARALVGDKRFEESRGEFRRLLEASPDNPDLLYAVGIISLQVNDLAEAEKHMQRLVATGRGELDAAHYYLGQLAEQGKRSDDALRWYGGVKAGEHFVPSRLRAAQLLLKLERLDEARAKLATARNEHPEEAVRLRIAEAQVLRETKRYQDAYTLLAAGLEADNDEPDLLYETALAAEKVGQFEVLERHLRTLIRLKPEAPQAYNALGYSFADRNERLAEAATLIDKALALAPDDAFIIDSKGWLLFRQGQAQEALGYLQKAYATRPDPEIAAHIGEVLWVLGRRDEALALWREAVKANPGNDLLTATIKRLAP